MAPLDAPIFMLPLAGMMFLAGAITHQLAGDALVKSGYGPWSVLSFVGLALQIGAVVILISA
jgi:hypothetical protein